MARTLGLQNTWHAGMKRDVARDRMPTGSLWNAVDVIASYGAPLRERAGWTHHASAASAVTGTASYIRAGMYATFSNSAGGETSKNLALDEDGHLFNVTSAGSCANVGAAVQAAQNPVFHGGAAASAATAVFTGLAILPDGTGTAVPKKYDGTTLSDLGGTPPKARYATVYKDYTVLGNGTVGSTYYPNRIWFSQPGDPDCAVSSATAWDTTDSWIDMSNAVKGLWSTRNALLVFHEASTTRIRGSIPPPDEDMIVDDGLFDVGLLDPFSVAAHHDNVVWAAPEGLFRTDGAILDDLTRRGGMLRYWLDLMADATSTWTISGGVQRDTYFMCVMDGTTFKDAFAIDLLSLSWTRMSNVDAVAMWGGKLNEADELYWGRRGDTRVARMDSIFQVGDSSFKNDGDGDAVAAVVETPYYALGGTGAKRLRRVFLTELVQDFASDNPTCAVSYALTPEAVSYTAAATATESTAMQRVAFDVRKATLGVAFKLVRANAGDFALHALEAEAWEYEPTRRL